MNFIITSSCNKGCPYCFASHDRSQDEGEKNMSIETFKEYLDKIGDRKAIKLLGGEPTQHPEFKQFVDEALKRNIDVTVISNFLFSDDVRDYLIETMKVRPLHFLINSTDLDNNEKRLETFKKNYLSIYSFLYQRDAEQNMSCGITFENDKDAEYYVGYISFLLEHLKKIETLRLSLNFPGNPEDKNKFDLINNKAYGEKFLVCIKKCLDNGISPSIDCTVYPCLFDNKEEFKFISKFIRDCRTTCGVNSPTDIFKDKSASFCYPLRDSIKTNTEKYDTIDQISKSLTMKYKMIESNVAKPEQCMKCKFLHCGICNGPCLGFYDLSKIKYGNDYI